MFYQLPKIDEALFVGAAAYRQRVSPGEVGETSSRYFPYTERHVQALWFDDSLRPQNLKTSRGEPVMVENPGRWNLEAGPDFPGAVLLVGREQRRVAGDAEIHIFSNDWKNHGHHTDPRYEGVRFHITWFPGTADESLFPPGTVHISLSDICATDLERIDVTAYPHSEPRASEEFPMVGKNPDEIFQCLENAGQERLRQKTQRMAWLMRERGEAQALYEETAAALGYKNNKAPFRNLARKVPLSVLAQYGDDWETVYAVLLGISGLLPKQPGAKWSAESKAYFRSLWDCWWREEHKWEEVPRMSRADWNFSGLRPLNHPVRRLCALAQYAASGFFNDALATRSAVPQRSCFWTEHIGWTGTEKPAELVGKGRLQAMAMNVFAPFRLAKGDASALEHLPLEPTNSIIRETAYTLFGPDHSPKLYCTALARQGLIQIFNDLLLTGRIDELK
ncbi:MAG: DUF2851 family protein [Kiritimatiellales bacterium]|nr:DUF2851 family protein [Kiritimatiellales bacterium]